MLATPTTDLDPGYAHGVAVGMVRGLGLALEAVEQVLRDEDEKERAA
jgi:hypothetical protein